MKTFHKLSGNPTGDFQGKPSGAVQAREPLFTLVSNSRLELTFIRRLNPQLFFPHVRPRMPRSTHSLKKVLMGIVAARPAAHML